MLINQNIPKYYYPVLISLFFFTSCTQKSNELVIGTFNVKWLGDGKNDKVQRSDKDNRRIAGIIRNLNADILALQEIENTEALNNVNKYLNDYSIVISKDDSQQKAAYFIRENLEIIENKTYFPIEILKGETRPALNLKVKFHNEIIHLMNAHFKSTSRYDSTAYLRQLSFELRTKQTNIAVAYADSLLKAGEKNFVLIGDLNDNPLKKNRETMDALKYHKHLHFLTDGLPSCRNKLWRTIDHIIVSDSLFDNYLIGSSRIINFNNSIPDKFTEKLSDHCPVLATFIFE